MAKKLSHNELINEAVKIIKENPMLGKNKVSSILREKYGSGLRHSTVLKLKKENLPEFQFLKSKQDKALKQGGFLPEEREFYTKQNIKISSSGMLKVRRWRKNEIRQAIKQGIPIPDIDKYIRQSYQARGWVEQGKVQTRSWNNRVFEIVQKPIKERKGESVLIRPENYTEFKQVIKRGKFRLNPSDALKMSLIIPASEWKSRLDDYWTLIQAGFLNNEAIRIITGTYRTKDNKEILRPLDLGSEAWQRAMAKRQRERLDTEKRFIQKGFSPNEARLKTIKDLEFRFKERENEPFDYIREYYGQIIKKTKYEQNFNAQWHTRETKAVKKSWKRQHN